MARSPAEADEDDASAESGGWRGRPCFAVGAEVEVRLDGPGFRGAHFEATVAARRPRSGGYDVVFSTLLARRGGPPLREFAAATHVRPRPPPPPPGRKFKRFDLVEAFHDDGWWPAVVSVVRQGRKKRYAVSFPLFREQVDLPASLVRPRREFMFGSWEDAQEVLPGSIAEVMPLYPEGSIVEVMYDEEKQGRAWMSATIIKMVGDASYVVRYGNGKSSTEILHSSFIRPPPVFDRMKFEYELEPSAEVEVYQDGIWTGGIVADVGFSEPRRYGVMIKRPYTADEDNYLLVSSSSLRPYSKWDAPQWWRSNKKHAEKEDYAVFAEESFSTAFSTLNKNSDEEFCSPKLSKASRDSDHSYVPKKRVRKENDGKKEPHLKHCVHLRKDTAKSLLETPPDKHAAWKSEESVLGTKGKDLLSISSPDDISKIDKSSYLDVITISDDSGCRSVIEISDNSSSIPNRKKRRMNVSDDTLHSSHDAHPYQVSRPPLNLLQAHNTQQDLIAEVSRHSEEQPCSHVLSQSVLPRVSHDPSNKDGGQLIPLPGCSVQGLLRMNETKEPIQSDHLHSGIALRTLDDSAAADENHEMCQDVIEGKSWMDGTCSKAEDTILINSINSNQETVDLAYGEDFPNGKLKPSSSAQQDVNADLSCMQAPYDSKREIGGEGTSMYIEEAANFPIDKIEPVLSSQDVKADPLFMQASDDDKMEIKCERTGMSAEEAAVFHHHNYMNSKKIADVSCLERSTSLQHPLSQLQLSISKKSAEPSSFMHPALTVDLSSLRPLPAPSSNSIPPVFSTSSLLLMPDYKMEVFKMLPQKNLHFHEVRNCPSEFQEGKALGLMLSFANMAESIKNMQIQDDPQLYQEKMSNLIDLEENGFDVSALKVRLDDLLRIRNRQIDLKKRKATLDKELLKLDVANYGVEKQLKLLEMCMTGLGEEPFREKKASLVTQHSANNSYISKFQLEMRQVEESMVSVEADFNNTVASPWCSDGC
ncbi:hypothetical protein EJB05_15888, partial [Eragrostis curvula]